MKACTKTQRTLEKRIILTGWIQVYHGFSVPLFIQADDVHHITLLRSPSVSQESASCSWPTVAHGAMGQVLLVK